MAQCLMHPKSFRSGWGPAGIPRRTGTPSDDPLAGIGRQPPLDVAPTAASPFPECCLRWPNHRRPRRWRRFPWRSVLTCAQTSRSWISSSGRAVLSCRRVNAMCFDDCVGAGMNAGRIPYPQDPPVNSRFYTDSLHVHNPNLHNVINSGDWCTIWLTKRNS